MLYPEYKAKLMQAVITNDKYRAKLPAPQVKVMAAKAEAGEAHPLPKNYTFNATGNILVSSTAESLGDDPEAKSLFKKAAVFFAATTAALDKKGKTLYDYDAINAIVSSSGLFVAVHREDRTLDYMDTKVAIDTAIVKSALSAMVPGIGTAAGSIDIAKTVLGHMGDQIQLYAEAKQATKKVGHLLFVVENLMGMPLVSASIFNIDQKQGSIATKSNCHQQSSSLFQFKYHQDIYLFVDPDYIATAGDLDAKSPEYQALIDKLASAIKEEKKEPEKV
jgi:hypothetical protein